MCGDEWKHVVPAGLLCQVSQDCDPTWNLEEAPRHPGCLLLEFGMPDLKLFETHTHHSSILKPPGSALSVLVARQA